MANEISDLVMTTLRDLGAQQLLNIAANLMNLERMYHSLTTPEEREAGAKYWADERARLDAIERSKSPAQKLREKQAACHHEFNLFGRRYRCTRCQLRASLMFVTGYRQGYEHGHDDGRDAASDE